MHIGLLKIIEKHTEFACNGILFNHESPREERHLLQEKLQEDYVILLKDLKIVFISAILMH